MHALEHIRVSLCLLLLGGQAVSLGHLALAAHSIAAEGVVVELRADGDQGHFELYSSASSHVCATDVTFDDGVSHECLVASVWSSPKLAGLRCEKVFGRAVGLARLLAPRRTVGVAEQFQPLSRAPKASPPVS